MLLQPQCYTLLPQLVCADQWTVVAAHEYLVRLPDRGGWTGSGQWGEWSGQCDQRDGLGGWTPALGPEGPTPANAMLRQGRTLPASPPIPCTGKD